MPTEKPRITITMTEDEFKRVEAYRFETRQKNQTQAILSLVRLGLEDYIETSPDLEGPRDEKEKVYPKIYVAAKIPDGTEYAAGRNEILLTLAHELTHYFQWYLIEDEKRSDRGLEIQAGKYARRIVDEYLNA